MMQHVGKQALIMFLHVVVACAGLVSLYLAFFIYRDERDRLQNRLVDLWSYVSSEQEIWISRQTEFLAQCAKLAEAKVNSLLGLRTFSLVSVNVSAWLSFASYGCGYLYVLTSNSLNRISTSTLINTLDLVPTAAFTLIALFAGFYVARRLTRNTIVGSLFLTLLPISIFAVSYLDAELTYPILDWVVHGLESGRWWRLDSFRHERWTWISSAYYLRLTADFAAAILVGILVDIAALALIRKLLATIRLCSNPLFLLLAAGLNFAVMVTLLYGFRLFLNGYGSMTGSPYKQHERVGSILVLSFGTDLFVLFASSIMLLIAGAALVHWVLWPLLGRSVFAVVDNKVFDNKKLLGILGASLLGVGFPVLKPFIRWAESLF